MFATLKSTGNKSFKHRMTVYTSILLTPHLLLSVHMMWGQQALLNLKKQEITHKDIKQIVYTPIKIQGDYPKDTKSENSAKKFIPSGNFSRNDLNQIKTILSRFFLWISFYIYVLRLHLLVQLSLFQGGR